MLSSPQPLASPSHGSHKKKQSKLNVDGLKSDTKNLLEPGQKKLKSIETQRIIAVLDETIKRFELVSHLQHAGDNMEQFSIIFGPKLTGAIREHQRLHDRLQQQLRRVSTGKEANGDFLEDRIFLGSTNPALSAIREGIKSNVRNILRLFSANPVASQTLRSKGCVQDLASQKLIETFRDLRDCVYEMFLNNHLEQNEQMRYYQKMITSDQKNRVFLATLEDEVDVAIHDRDAEVFKVNEVIRNLKIKLHQLEISSDVQVKNMIQEGESQQRADRRAEEIKCAKIEQDLKQLRSQLNATIAENQEIEIKLRKKQDRLEAEQEYWIEKYDAEMGKKQSELEDIEGPYTEEKAHLEDLREKLVVMEVEYAKVMEERQRAQMEKEAAEKELAAKNKAATVIQAYWKGYLVRRKLKSKKKKTRKGKGKGGKGKGKKK
uniref:Dynein regulatory complex protein 10 n=1 Tax=Leptobrachium leishanense TaxID=445787 RepID=A0A8C5LUL9_9ANUR